MARAKRQARLTFNPLPTSSATSSPEVQEHGERSYANVDYEGSPRKSKRRRVAAEEESDEEGEICHLVIFGIAMEAATRVARDEMLCVTYLEGTSNNLQ
jgi:hypothetical protein